MKPVIKSGRRHNPLPAQTDKYMALGQKKRLAPSDSDKLKTLLLIIDMQMDFIHPTGSLSVPGALDDTQRVIDFIFKNTEKITTIAASLDSHVPQMIFFPCWWINSKGEHPPAFTTITLEDFESKKWIPVVSPNWSKIYIQDLESTKDKKQLTIWPYHTLIGTTGHLLDPRLSESITYHSAARQTNPIFIQKGSVPQVEHYGIFAAEVVYHDRFEETALNSDFLDTVCEYDRIIVVGEAKSHCVLETLNQMAHGLKWEYRERIFVLTDCMSSVRHPEIDFDSLTEKAFIDLKRRGINFTDSLSLNL